MMDDDTLKEAIHSTIAKQILDGLDTSARDALLHRALIDTVKNYKFRSAVNDVAAKKAASVAAELLNSDEWTDRITQAIERGFQDYLVELRKALPELLKHELHGSDKNFSRTCGRILGCWPKVTDDDDQAQSNKDRTES